MKDRKAGEQDKPDVEIHSAASFEYLHAKKSGKVNICFYSNHQEQKFHESNRENLPEELQDGDTCKKGKIRVCIENSIQYEPGESGIG